METQAPTADDRDALTDRELVLEVLERLDRFTALLERFEPALELLEQRVARRRRWSPNGGGTPQ